MGVFRSLFGRKKQVPFETTIHVSIPLDDEDDLDDLDLRGVLDHLGIDAPPGIQIDQVEVSARVKNRR